MAGPQFDPVIYVLIILGFILAIIALSMVIYALRQCIKMILMKQNDVIVIVNSNDYSNMQDT